ncbi:MAG TPA: murein transglycosylase A [Sphingobium sp.]
MAAMSALAFAISACTVIPEGARVPGTPPPRPSRPTTSVPLPSPGTAAPVTDGAAVAAGVTGGPNIDSLLPADSARLADALRAFRASCPSLLRRTDASGLTVGSDWQSACSNAASWSDDQAREFFRRNFEAVQIGDGRAYATGYYEPEILGCRTATSACSTPIYRRPDNLIDVDLGKFSDALKGKTIRGKVSGTNFIPYDERAEIIDGSLSGRGLEIAYANDPIELFFLEVQGSGRLRLPNGDIMRVGYSGQNGRDYTGIGKLMKDRGLIKAGSMQDIMQWLRANPVDGRKIMNENRSYIFFREVTGAGPLGALGIAVSPRVTVAADPKYVPLGAPLLLSVDRGEANGVWVAQDTGGAIKGANRFDTFWGAGSEARTIAGGMSARGSVWLLLPIGTATRLSSR